MIRKNSPVSILNILLISLLLVQPLVGRTQEQTEKKDRPKVALVLSGGGAKGFAHIGVLKVLEEEGIPIDMIVGTSMGSLVGGIYSIGYNADELEALVKSMNWELVLSDDVPREYLSKNDQLIKQRYIFSLPINGQKKLSLPEGMLKGQNVLNIFCGLAGNVPTNADFSKFPISFACVTTDLETGRETVLRNGFLPTAMFSSMAIPVAFQSFERDDHLLVDGGLVNNFPTDVAKRMGADIIIGVDIRSDFYNRSNLKSINNVAKQLVGFFDLSKDSVNNSVCDIIIYPEISDYSVTSFTNEAADTLIERGKKAGNKFRSQFRELKAKYQLEPREKLRTYVKSDKWHITDLSFTGNYHLDPDFLRKTLNLKIPGDYSPEDIKNAIDMLYGLGGFDRVYYNLTDVEDGKNLNINISTKKVFTQNVGFKANTTDAAAILLNVTHKNYGNTFGMISASGELSINPGLSVTAETNKTNLPTIGLNVKSKYQNYNVFDKGDKIYEANVFYASGSAYIYKPFLRRFSLGLGIQEEFYQGDVFKRNDNYPVAEGKTEDFTTNAFSYLSFDNMDDYYFPTRGTNLYTEFSLLGNFGKPDELCPVMLFKMRNVIPLTPKTALLFDLYGRALYNSDSPQTKQTLVGGEQYSQYFSYHLPFVGLSAINISDRYTYIGLTGLRMQFAKSQYVSLLFNAMRQSPERMIWDDGRMIYGGGIKYSVKTLLGPLDLTLGYSGWNDKPTFSANFGYWF